MQLVGNRELAGNEILERPCLTASELVPFQNHAGLRGWTRTGRPYPAFHEIRKSSTCGFDFTDYGMPEGSRPGPVNRHGFEIAGWAGARLVPIMGLVPAGWPLGGWRPAPRKRKNGGRRDSRCPKGAGRVGGGHAAARGARPRGPDRASRAPRSRARPASPAPPPKDFSEIVLASAGEFPYSTFSHGGVAQLGERLTGSQEVRGSIPLVSTRALNEAPTQVGAFFHIGTQGQRRHHDPPGRQDRKKLRRARPL